MQLKGRNSARGGGEDNTAQIFGFLVAHLNARTEPRVSFLSTNVTSSSGGLGWSRSGSQSVNRFTDEGWSPLTCGTSWGRFMYLGS